MSQIRMNRWLHGRVVLLGDAAYCVSPATGQGTTAAMVGAYVLAGELAAHGSDLKVGVTAYEAALRDYATRNQDSAVTASADAQSVYGERTAAQALTHPNGIPDFGRMVQPFALKSYQGVARAA